MALPENKVPQNPVVNYRFPLFLFAFLGYAPFSDTPKSFAAYISTILKPVNLSYGWLNP
jgi:hypothetical protein